MDPIPRLRSSQALKPGGVTRSASPQPAERAEGAESGPQFPSGVGAEPDKGKVNSGCSSDLPRRDEKGPSVSEGIRL